jgi:predicted RNA methylase
VTTESLERIRDRGYTPAARDFGPLFDMLAGEEEEAEAVERCLARAGLPAGLAAIDRLAAARPPARARLMRLVGRVAQIERDPRLEETLRVGLRDADTKTQRYAIGSIGRARVLGCEPDLLDLWTGAPIERRRAIAEALGKVGGTASLELLRAVNEGDTELTRRIRRAILMLERTLGRTEPVAIALDRALPSETDCILLCRPGLAKIVAEQIQAVAHGQVLDRSQVGVRWRGRLGELLTARSALDVALPLPLAGGGSLEQQVIDTLVASDVIELLAAWTIGTPRFRLRWEGAGHQRARTWRIAQEIAARTDRIVNDPVGAAWEIVCRPEAAMLLAIARGFEDPRFAYRRADVPGASHPTIAAALAHVAGVHSDDIVWDPFVGGGLELVERARLGPYRTLVGSDSDERALAAAGENLAAASVPAALELADARTHRPAGVTLIITNPPMGRRSVRAKGLAEILDAFLQNAASVLTANGRIVWLSPFPARTLATARRLGLRAERVTMVDLGGFEAELQRLTKPARRG